MTDLAALSYTAEHEWIAREGDVATIGITDHAASQLGDIVFLDLPAVGTAVVAGEVCGEIESTKSVGELYAPVSGEVLEINEAAIDDPSLLNAEPFEGGWLLRVRAEGDAPDTLDRDAYVALTGGAA